MSEARYTGPDGLTHSAPTTFATEEDAHDWLIVTEADIIRGEWWNPNVGRVPFGPYAARWVEERTLSPTTRQKYELYLRRHVGPTFKATDLIDISPARARAWRPAGERHRRADRGGLIPLSPGGDEHRAR